MKFEQKYTGLELKEMLQLYLLERAARGLPPLPTFNK